MLRNQIKKLAKVVFTRRLPIYYRNNLHFLKDQQVFRFSEEKKNPKGFEKFSRKNKETSSQKENNQSSEQPKQDPPSQVNQEANRKDSEPKPENPNLKQDQTQSPKENTPKPDNLEKPDPHEKAESREKAEKTETREKTEKSEESKEEPNKGQHEQKKQIKFSFQEIFDKLKNNPRIKAILPKTPQDYFKLAMLAVLAAAGGKLAYDYYFEDHRITYNDFIKEYLERDQISKIYIQRVPEGAAQKHVARIILINGEFRSLVLGNVDHFLERLEKIQQEKGRSKENFIPVEFDHLVDHSKQFDRVLNILYLGVTVAIMYSLFRSLSSSMGGMGGKGDGIFGVGKSNAKVFGIDSQVKVKFKDVAGLDEAKMEISEFVDFLKKPKKYKEIGARLPRGALLSGPPGTGKTMLAKACAGEAGVPFYYISGSDFVEMFVGVGASRVRDLFKQAKSKSPSIIFIDEIDAVGRKREARIGGNDERDNTLNQLLVEMDGFGTDAQVVVLAATNKKDMLDSALTRPGRFDRTIEVNLPDIDGRREIFLVHLKPLKLDPSKATDEFARRLATLTPGFSGAEIANLCNEAAILAARKGKNFVGTIDFEMASERIMAGLEKKKLLTEKERKVVAIHESGHAVVSWFLKGGNPLLKLTIIPRSKGSLGYAQYLPNENSLETKGELLDRIACILGGRLAEEEFFGEVTTGAYDDLQKAYGMAHAIVTKFGMSDKIGLVGFKEEEYTRRHSETTQREIDEEIKRVIDEQSQITREKIKEFKGHIEKLSSALLEKETLDLKAIIEILGERPFPSKENFKAYLETKASIEAEQSVA